MNELIPVVTFNLPVISTNFGELKAQLAEGLKKYDIEVTVENLPEAKTMATDLNKLSKVLATVRKEKTAELDAPIKGFEAQAKELEQLCQASREKLLAQVKKFEDETRATAARLLQEALGAKYAEQTIRPKFQTATVSDLAILSSLTKTKSLTAAASREVDARTGKCLSAQLQYDGRLARLEADCYKAGLSAPLQEAHVADILNRSEDEYAVGLKRIIQIELDRQKVAEERLRKEAEEKVRREERARIRQEEEAKAKAAREEAARVVAEEKAKRETEEAAKTDPVAPVSLPASASKPFVVATRREPCETKNTNPTPEPAGVDVVVAFRTEMFDHSDDISEYLLAAGIATRVYRVSIGRER